MKSIGARRQRFVESVAALRRADLARVRRTDRREHLGPHEAQAEHRVARPRRQERERGRRGKAVLRQEPSGVAPGIGKVVDREEAQPRDLARYEEVPEVGAAEPRAEQRDHAHQAAGRTARGGIVPAPGPLALAVERRYLLLALASALLVIAFQLPFLKEPLGVDESVYYTVASSKALPYIRVFDQKPPLV